MESFLFDKTTKFKTSHQLKWHSSNNLFPLNSLVQYFPHLLVFSFGKGTKSDPHSPSLVYFCGGYKQSRPTPKGGARNTATH